MMLVVETIRGTTHLVPEQVVGFRPVALTQHHRPSCAASAGARVACQCQPEQVTGTEVLTVGGGQQVVCVEPPDVVVARWSELLEQIANPDRRARIVVPVAVPRVRGL